MNPFPHKWTTLIGKHTAPPLVLIDGAMQQRFGRKLAHDPDGAISLFAQYSSAAQELGPWLMTDARAESLGITGCARGVNWIATTLTIKEALAHLMLWMRGHDSEARTWLRLADARSLAAFMTAWSEAQSEAFCDPWLAWCYADRNGSGQLLNMPLKREISTPVSTALNSGQKAVLDSCTAADRLIHEYKSHTSLHSSMIGCLERRHTTVQAVLRHAAVSGYQSEGDLSYLVIWALRKGVSASSEVTTLEAVRHNLSGKTLWNALNSDAENGDLV